MRLKIKGPGIPGPYYVNSRIFHFINLTNFTNFTNVLYFTNPYKLYKRYELLSLVFTSIQHLYPRAVVNDFAVRICFLPAPSFVLVAAPAFVIPAVGI